MPTDDRPTDSHDAIRDAIDADLEDLITRIHADDQVAAETLYNKYHRPVKSIIRKFLRKDSPLRRDFDSDDFLIMTWQSVFRELEVGKTVSSSADFLSLIQAVTRNHFISYC